MLLPSRDIACVVLTNHDGDEALMERVRDSAIRTLVPKWSWKTYDTSKPDRLSSDLQGHWHGAIEVETRSVPVELASSGKEATFQIADSPAERITGLGLADGLVVGTTHGRLKPVETQQVNLSLRLLQNGSRLTGEIDLLRPIPHARTQSVMPFWIQLSR
jgi:hypothetical protein